MGFLEIGIVSAIIGVSKNWGWGSENAHPWSKICETRTTIWTENGII